MALSELFFSFCIENLSHCYSVRYSPRSLASSVYRPYFRSDWVFRKHISCALPMYRIFDLLRSIHPDFFIRIRDGSRELKLQVESLEIIIKWLQVSVLSECNRQIPQTKNLICFSRDLLPNDRQTCMVALFVTKRLSLDFDQSLPNPWV